MSYRTDRARVTGLGSARDGTRQWWEQRVSAVALAILTPLFVFPFAYNLGSGFERVHVAYSHPVNAVIAIAFIITVFLHLYQGLQVVIEDYVVNKRLEIVLVIAARLFSALTALVGVFAIMKIALGG